MKKQLPNVVSASRLVLFGPLVAYCKITGHPLLAFAFGVLGVMTDQWDGWLAVRLNAVSDFGKRWVDPVCDFGFSIAIVTGFTWEDGHYHSARAIVSAGMIVSAGICKLLKEFSTNDRVRDFFAGFTPAYYCIAVIVFLYLYAQAAFGPTGMAVVNWITLPLTGIAAIWKRNRLRAWWRDLASWAKKCFGRTRPVSSSAIG